MNETSFYHELNRDLNALLVSETAFLAALSNFSALLYDRLEAVNWVGFYLLTEANTLVLGPFQGKIACVRIPIGKGVCGTAIAEKKIQRIDNVHNFPGHIACDAASNAEIVIPLKVNNQFIGVLDIDSIEYNRFDQKDETGLVMLTNSLCTMLEESNIEGFLNLPQGKSNQP